ncbi:hypothetical protein ACHAWU_008820 [Discostella pseudostelligera]|uniref:Uncharacterized protein n=1 Tax=Discostella pseudostelligera TaxID=259834 RepID=A0ABD3MZV7_9STRA
MEKRARSAKVIGRRDASARRRGTNFLLCGVYTCCLFTIIRFPNLSPYILGSFPLAPTTPQQQQQQEDGGRLWEIVDTPNCFHLDNICSWKDGWFYDHGPHSTLDNTTHMNQPSAALILDKQLIAEHGWHDPGTLDIDFRIHLNISSTSHGQYDDNMCSYSSTPNHLVVQSFYNDMMGEFYARTIIGLQQLMRMYPPHSNDDIQTYIHFINKKWRIFEGHELFLSGLPNNNELDNFLSLMPRNDSCRCFRRLILCGYHGVDEHDETLDGQWKEYVNKTGDGQQNRYLISPTHGIEEKNASASKWQELRVELIDGISKRYNDLDQKIRGYQRQVLFDQGLLGGDIENSTRNVDEWKFVGLARRKYRRSWLNINDTLSMCNERFQQHHIVCLIVDVEDSESAEEQLIMHRSLDAFIGIHGAQLTQGILLPSHGLMLELLPYIPLNGWGGWTACTEAPTALGVIFENTDLNHFGYSLGTESCSSSCNLGFNVRDFNVSTEVIADFLSTFVLKAGKNSTMTCDDMKNETEERERFVLYNAFCQPSLSERAFINEHYYHARPRLEEDEEDKED